jgi:tetratricopeptide (TPR) repeat protein/transcriptional regulator with XRE-family HTH domain
MMPSVPVIGTSRTGFGHLLRQFRRSVGITQEELAELAGISPRSLRDLEGGRVSRPRRSTVDGLARGLGLAADDRARLLAAAWRPAPAPDLAAAVPAARAGTDPDADSDPGGSGTAVADGHRMTPAQLPADIMDFTGRQAELARITRLFHGNGVPQPTAPVAIVGSAGVGKTALAVHWAHQAADRGQDGQLYINLRGYATTPQARPIEALSSLLRGLGVDPQRIPVDLDEATALFRTIVYRRRLVIVLDNAASSSQVRPLLPGSPTCLVLVTSRNHLTGLLAREGARILTLGTLTEADALTLVGRIAGSRRLQTEPAASAELTRLCGRLPLALRIAAAKLAQRPHGTVASLIADMTEANRLAALEVDGDEGAALRAAFDLSYGPLVPGTRRLFRYLSLVPGPDFTTPVAAALAGLPPDDTATLLGQLVSAHLVEEHVADRYRLHDLIRLYAAQRAGSDDDPGALAAAAGRFRHWYLCRASAAAELLYPQLLRLPGAPPALDQPFTGLGQASEWLDAERSNLMAAIEAAADDEPAPEAWLMADALRGYFSLRRHTIDWLAAAQAGRQAAAAAGDARAQAGCELSIAHAHWSRADYPQSAAHYENALSLARTAGWSDGEATILGNLGLVCWELGRAEESVAHLTGALALDRQTGRLAGQANNLANLGYVCRVLGRPGEAADHCQEALALYRAMGSSGGMANSLGNLALVYRDLGQPAEANAKLREALRIYREIGDRANQADALNNLTTVSLDAGDTDTARELAEAALELARQIGDRRAEADAVGNIAAIFGRHGEHQLAWEYHEKALRLAAATRTCYQQIEALTGLAVASAHLGRDHDAVPLAALASGLARIAGYRILEQRVRERLADLA